VIRVLLADDQALLRAGFRMLLDSAGDIEVAGEADNGGVAVAMAREHRPHVVLMDLHMPEVDGVTATRLITADPKLAGVRVVVLTTFDDDETVFAALRAGASGFLVKDIEPADLLQAIRIVARGDALLSPSVTRAVIATFAAGKVPDARPATPKRPRPGLDSLTEREREVVALVAAGLSNDEIARKLVVSPLTAKTHVSRAMTKVGARDRAQLVVFAYEHGLVALRRDGRCERLGHRTARRARPGHAAPAVPAQHPGLPDRGLARFAVHVAPHVSTGLDALGAGHHIAVIVAMTLLVRVPQLAVELHHDPVLLVVGVPVCRHTVDDDTRLVLRLRQAMRPFHITQIAEFERRMNSVARRREYLIEFGAPAHLLTFADCDPEILFGGVPLSAGSGNPPANVINRLRRLCQVEHRLLDAGPWRPSVGLRRLGDSSGNVDEEPGSRYPPGGRDGDVDGSRWPGVETVQLSGGVVTECGTRPGPQHGRPQLRLPARRPREQRVNAPVHLLPIPAPKTLIERAPAHSRVKQLLPRNHPSLPRSNLPNPSGNSIPPLCDAPLTFS
jgi:DNA-binding NarL/FixJ family response regulator